MKVHPEDCAECAESLAAMDEEAEAAALEVADALIAPTVAGTLSPEEQEFLHRVCTGAFSSRLRGDQLELAERLEKRQLIERCGAESQRGVPYRRTRLGDAVARLNEADQAPSRWAVRPVVKARLLEEE